MLDRLDLELCRQKKIVCVLGMHRSGTSMTTRILNLMGVSLGKPEKMVPPNKNDNEEGFWEHTEIVNIHEEILKELNSSWESTVPLPDKWWEFPNIEQYKIKLIEVVKNELSDYTIWGFKDPRTCIMLPLWKDIFGILDIDPMFIIPIRNPIDIANSLIKRDGCSLNQGTRLWYYYMINILEGTQEYNRKFIKYDDLLENIDSNVMKLADFLGINVSEESKKSIKESLKPNLRHSKTNIDELKLLANKQIVELYKICIKFAEGLDSDVDLKLHSSKIYKLYNDLMGAKYADKKIEVFVTSLFIDYGTGYSEETSIKQRIAMNEKDEFNVYFELGNAGENIKNLRWDALEGKFCKCIIDQVLINNESVEIENSNADYFSGNKFDFLTIDPICIWKNKHDLVKTVCIRGKIIFYKSFELQSFLEKEKEKLIYCENEKNLRIDQLKNENNLRIEQLSKENENDRLMKENEIRNLENKYKILYDNKRKADEEIQLILNSPSWKITKPLRFLKRVLLKFLRRKN